MERLTIPPDVSVELGQTLTDMMDNITGQPLILTTEPTTANKILAEGQVGFYNSFKYETINGNTYKTPLTLVP